MVEALEAHGITYEIEAMPVWHDCARIAKQERTQEEQEALFASCCAKTILTILNSRIYQCPFAANAVNLGALPISAGEGIALDGSLDLDTIRDGLFDMLRTKQSTSACEYCAGRPFGALHTPVAVQARSSLPYTTLSITGT